MTRRVDRSNIVARAESIASRMQKQHERELYERGIYPYSDWPTYWLETYNEVLKELAEEPQR